MGSRLHQPVGLRKGEREKHGAKGGGHQMANRAGIVGEEGWSSEEICGNTESERHQGQTTRCNKL